MNAHNQRRNKNPDSLSFTKYKNDGDSYKALIRKFSSNVENKIVEILIKEKKFSEKDANIFMKNLFSLDPKRNLDQRKEIGKNYTKGKSVDECARFLLDKYYKITVVNKYQSTQKFQTDRNLGGEGEETEVTENKYINNIYHNLASFSEFVVNEGLRDKMRPRSDDEIEKSIISKIEGKSKEELNDYFVGNSDNYEEYKYILDYLIDNNLVDINHISEGETALISAVQSNDLDYVKKLIDNGAGPYEEGDLYNKLPYFKGKNIKPNSFNLAKVYRNMDIYNYLNSKFKANEKVDYSKFKKVAPSLLFNFLNKVNELGLKFKLNTTYIKNITNSLNNKNYVLYMKTNLINDNEIKEVFKFSKLLSNILQHIEDNEHNKESGFYIGIDSNSHIHFGLISNEKKFKIGYTKYTSNDFKKIIPFIESDKQVDLNEMSKKIVSKLYSIDNAKKVFDLHLDKYDEDVDLYINIIDNLFTVVIETLDDDIITVNYIEDMVKNYVKFSQYTEWELKKQSKSNKTVYYFTLK